MPHRSSTGNPHIAEVIVVPRTRGWQRIRDDFGLARRLRAERFDLVIDLHGGPRSSWLTWATGAPERIGYDIQGRRWHVHADGAPPARPPGRGIRSRINGTLLSALPGWPDIPPDPARDPAEMALDKNADARIDDRLRAAGVDHRHDVTVIHVSAGNPFRRWPESAFATLVAALAAADDRRRIILSSGPVRSDGGRSHRRRRAAGARTGARAPGASTLAMWISRNCAP